MPLPLPGGPNSRITNGPPDGFKTDGRGVLNTAAAVVLDAGLIHLAGIALRLLDDKCAAADVLGFVQISRLRLRGSFVLCAHESKQRMITQRPLFFSAY